VTLLSSDLWLKAYDAEDTLDAELERKADLEAAAEGAEAALERGR
jgi:hypothetical protein